MHKFAKARTQSVDYRVLDEICTALDCQPGDLLIRVLNGENKGRRAVKKKAKARPAKKGGEE